VPAPAPATPAATPGMRIGLPLLSPVSGSGSTGVGSFARDGRLKWMAQASTRLPARTHSPARKIAVACAFSRDVFKKTLPNCRPREQHGTTTPGDRAQRGCAFFSWGRHAQYTKRKPSFNCLCVGTGVATRSTTWPSPSGFANSALSTGWGGSRRLRHGSS